jgi:putative ABC transport system substrate-binding protein
VVVGLTTVMALWLLAVPPATDAQPPGKVYRIGVLARVPRAALPKERPAAGQWNAFVEGLRTHGWIDGENFVFEFRYTEGKIERAPQLARELVGLRPDILVVTLGEPGIRALKEATTTIPIVMLVSNDPVGTGLVASLARPGGNITGMRPRDCW